MSSYVTYVSAYFSPVVARLTSPNDPSLRTLKAVMVAVMTRVMTMMTSHLRVMT